MLVMAARRLHPGTVMIIKKMAMGSPVSWLGTNCEDRGPPNRLGERDDRVRFFDFESRESALVR